MPDKITEIYNALKADGQFKQARSLNDFKQKMAWEGYRAQIYNNLQDAGADVGSFEHFTSALGYKPGSPTPKPKVQGKQQTNIPEPKTAAQKASVGGRQEYATTPQYGEYTNRYEYLKNYESDKKEYDKQFEDAVKKERVYRRVKKTRRYTSPKKMLEEQRKYEEDLNKPIVDTGDENINKYLVRTQEQEDKAMADSGKAIANESRDYIRKLLDEEFKKANDEALNENRVMPNSAESAMARSILSSRAYSEANSFENIQNRISNNIESTISNLISQPSVNKRIIEEAKKYNVTPEEYVRKAFAPQLMDAISNELDKKELDRAMPRSMIERTIASFVNSNNLAKLLNIAGTTKSQRQYMERAAAITEAGENPYYKPDGWDTAATVAGSVAGMITDPVFKGASKVGGAVTSRVMGNGASMASKIANGSVMQKLGYMAGSGAIGGGVTGATFGFVNGVVDNLSTGDDTSLWGTIKAATSHAVGEAGSFAAMGVVGAPLGVAGRGVGLKGTEKIGSKDWFKGGLKKVGLVTAGTFTEAFGMNLGGYVSANLQGHQTEFEAWNGTIDSLPTAIGFRLTHLKGQKFKDKKGKPLGFWGNALANFTNFALSDNVKSKNMVFTDHEKEEIIRAARRLGISGKEGESVPDKDMNIVSYAKRLKKKLTSSEITSFDDVEPYVEFVKTYYDAIISDPEVSWDAKAKLSTMLMGVIPVARPVWDYTKFERDGYGRKCVAEYSKDGVLLSLTPYETNDARDVTTYKIAQKFETDKLNNAMALAAAKDSEDVNLQIEFLSSRGYDESKPADDAENLKILSELSDKDSTLYSEYMEWITNRTDGTICKTIDAVSEKLGVSDEEIVKIWNKDPLKRTDEEYNIAVALRRELEKSVFPEDKPHPEQSQTEGKEVARENGLGTEQPNEIVVTESLRNLSEAEKAWDEAMESDDLLKQGFKLCMRKGMTPVESYQYMIENGYGTKETLRPLSDYINSNARLEGLQNATSQVIEEKVSQKAIDWGFHGTMDGEKGDGSKVVYVTDNLGRTLIVGSGEVAYDPNTGRPKDGIGDMLVCLDTEKGEMVYVKVEGTILSRIDDIETFKASERSRLEEINMQPYNEAAQVEAANAPTATTKRVESTGTAESKDETEEKPTQETANGMGIPSGQSTNGGSEKKAEPREDVLTFTDGTIVPMMKDSKGRETPDYTQMTAEQGVEMAKRMFGEEAESFVDGQIDRAFAQLNEAVQRNLDMSQDQEDAWAALQEKREATEKASNALKAFQEIKAKFVEERLGVKIEPEQPSENIPLTEDNKPSGGDVIKTRPSGEAEGMGTAKDETEQKTEEQEKTEEAVKLLATEITKQTGVPVHTDEAESQKTLEEAEATDSVIKYRKETDQETLDKLNSGKTIKVYRAMQVIDGKLYPPMAAAVDGQLVEPNELGVWIRADENPEMAIPDIDSKTGKQKVDEKTGELKWKFKLDKGGKDATGKKATSINAAYNPYWHTSRSPLNDQFKSAWIRPNIVIVECEVPESELTSGYKAERAKDAVGEVDWKSGSVSGEVFKQTGRARKVILSRWCKPVRVLSDAEVAERAKEFVGEASIEIPENVLTPKQRIAFEKAGFRIGKPEKGVNKSEQIADALKRGLEIDNSVREHRGSRWAGGEVHGMDKLPNDVRMNSDELYSEIFQYHGDYISRMLENVPEDSTGSFVSAHNGTWYVYSVSKGGMSINILDAIPASRENYGKFKELIKDYGFDTEAENIFSDMQKTGHSRRADSNMYERFLRGGTGRNYRLHSKKVEGERNDGDMGVDGRINGNTSSPRQFRTKNGEVYGFVVDGEIHLDTAKMKADTPLHEYTHLWTEALRRLNPKEWENVKLLFDEVDGLREEVQKLYPELKGDDLYDEMISVYSGREGTRKLTEDALRLADEEGKSLTESVKAMSFIEKVKDAVRRYWQGVADLLGVHFSTAEEVADKVLADWASERNPMKMQSREDRIKQTEEDIEGSPYETRFTRADFDKYFRLRDDTPWDKMLEFVDEKLLEEDGLTKKDLTEDNISDYIDQEAFDDYIRNEMKLSEGAYNDLIVQSEDVSMYAEEGKDSILFENPKDIDRVVSEYSEPSAPIKPESDGLKAYEVAYADWQKSPSKENSDKVEASLKSLSAEELREIANSSKSGFIAKELKRRTNVAMFDADKKGREIKKKKTAKGKLNLFNIAARKEKGSKVKMPINGVYHDPDGYAVSSDGHNLIALRSGYDETNSGKIVEKDGKEISGKYPNWRLIVPKDEDILSTIRIDTSDLYNFVAGIRRANKDVPEGGYVLLNFGNGIVEGVTGNVLKKMLLCMDKIGATELSVSGRGFLVAKGKDGSVAMCTTLLEPEEIYSYAYDNVAEKVPLMPKEETHDDPTDLLDKAKKAVTDFRKEHPLKEEEILKTHAFDDLPEDQKQYCIEAALDYLRGEDTSAISEAYYINIFNRRKKASNEVELTSGTRPSGEAEGMVTAANGKTEQKTENKKTTERKATEVQKTEETNDDSRKLLEAERDAADNEFEAFMKDLQKKRRSQLNSGFIDQNLIEAAPKMFALAAKCAYARIKLGVHDIKEVVEDLRNRFEEAFAGFEPKDIETFYTEIKNQKWRDGDKRMSLSDWADFYKKQEPEHKANLEGDSKTATEKKQKEDSFISNLKKVLRQREVKGINELRQMAKDLGLEDVKDTDLQELAETAIVESAREIANNKAISEDSKLARIEMLYENQPSLNQRDSERVTKQQYSTPAPYAYLAGVWVKGDGKKVENALEPSAGNGMLTIALPKEVVHVNDIDEARVQNLQRQGFKNVSSQDGTLPFADKEVDVVITNPPFGTAESRDYDGYTISSLEGQMAINALESMKDDGRAAIIIGGKTEYASNGSLKPKDKAFLGYLYSHYNVVDVINVDGELYKKQGTTYPTRLILIKGRRLNENSFPPVKSNARAEAVKTYDELNKRIKDDLLRSERMDTTIRDRRKDPKSESDNQRPMGADGKGLQVGERRRGEQSPSTVRGGVPPKDVVRGSRDNMEQGRGTDGGRDVRLSNGTAIENGTRPEPTEGTRRGDNSDRSDGRGQHEPGGAGLTSTESTAYGSTAVRLKSTEQKRTLGSEKVDYIPKSENPFTLHSVIPADQQEAVNNNLTELGDVDQYLVDQLGYTDKQDLYKHLAAEQIDSVALAIKQAEQGNGFIIGDMTGIGKGRQAAALVRYAHKNGQIPIYFTKTAGLLSDVYRDLLDIGSEGLRPFVLGSSVESNVTDKDGKVVYKRASDAEKDRVLAYMSKYGKLPKEYDYVLTTYSQVSSGIYEFDENGNKRQRQLKKGESFNPTHYSGQKKRDAIEAIMKNSYLILDESHTAGGESGQGNYFQGMVKRAKNVTYFSATYAKRPDNMPLYALRTAMSKSGVETLDLINAVRNGGVTLQELMSGALTQSGQMIRRERDMTGVTIDWRGIDDEAIVADHRERYDNMIGLFNDIIEFQNKYVVPYVNEINEAAAAVQASYGLSGKKNLGIANVPFASKAFNTVQQVLLSLKAEEAAKRAVELLKEGKKPVIALSNTNESLSGEVKDNEDVEEPDLGISLKKGLKGVLHVTRKGSKNEKEGEDINLQNLGPEAVAAYQSLERKIEMSTTGLALSPIDVMKKVIEEAGYSVGELSGRKTEFVYNNNGTVTKQKRTNRDKKKLAREFNNGDLDALILNKSASTGISLHASNKFGNTDQRVMIVVQQQLDVNDEVQMRGRVDRTGQVQRGAYEYIVSQIPAEQRLLMMFKAKLKSLDANTTSSQKSKFNEISVADITNEYGDRIVAEYLSDHLNTYSHLADPLKWEAKFGDDLENQPVETLLVNLPPGERGALASKVLGRMALLRVNEQEKMLEDINSLYEAEINRLNETGENTLEISELPLKAKMIGRQVWEEGSDPDSGNAFADNIYVEKNNVAVLKKPMKAEEVSKAQQGMLEGKSWTEYKEEKLAGAREYFEKKAEEEEAKGEKKAKDTAEQMRNRFVRAAKKKQKESGYSDEQIEQLGQEQYNTVYSDIKAKVMTRVENVRAGYRAIERVFDTFNTEDVYVLPSNIDNISELSAIGNSYGKLIDIKLSSNYSSKASTVTFATLDGRRRVTFKADGMVGKGENRADIISKIFTLTRQNQGNGTIRVLSMDFSNWDRLTPKEDRRDVYILTGNVLGAMIETQKLGLGGRLVKFTREDGSVDTGVLMPDRFNTSSLQKTKPITSEYDALNNASWREVTVESSDGAVTVKAQYDYAEIRVPKSRKKGGKYYLDEPLLKLVKGENFESRGNTMRAEVSKENLKPVLERLSELGVTAVDADNGIHFRAARTSSRRDTREVVEDHILKVEENLGVSTNKVNSIEEVSNPEVRKRIESGENVTGWYDEKTGEVYLYMPNIHDRYTAEKTMWHETVGHKGLRGLFGNQFGQFLQFVHSVLGDPTNADLKALVDKNRKGNPLGLYDAIEEGLAELVEQGKGSVGFWQKIKDKVTSALHEIGYRISPNVRDVKYMLWLSKNLQKHPNDPVWRARAARVRWKLRNEKPMTEIKGGRYEMRSEGVKKDWSELTDREWETAADTTIHFRTTPSAATEIDIYNNSLASKRAMAEEAYVDKMNSVKELMRAIDPSIKHIEDVPSSMNPIMIENLMHDVARKQGEWFVSNRMVPVTKAFNDVLDHFDGDSIEEKQRNAFLYMIKKSGLERNRHMYIRDMLREMRADESTKDMADQIESDYKALRMKLRDDLVTGMIRLNDFYAELDEFIIDNIDKAYEPGEHDYSGFHEMQGLDRSEAFDDAEIIDDVMSAESSMGEAKMKRLWLDTREVSWYIANKNYESGFISEQQLQDLRNNMIWYVPMRMFDKQTAEDVYGYIPEERQNGAYIGPMLMKAKGRKSLSELNVLAQLGAMGELAISRGCQNAIRQSFMHFIQEKEKAPVGKRLVTEMKVWEEKIGVDASGKEIWEEKYPQIPDDASPEEVNEALERYEREMQEKKERGEAKVTSRRNNIGYIFAKKENKPQHCVDVWVNGEKKTFVVNGNPRAAQAINGMLSHSGARVEVLKNINMYLSQAVTSYNPEFVLRNAIRDYTFASHSLLAKEGLDYAKNFEKHYLRLGLSPIVNAAKGVGKGSVDDVKNALFVSMFKQYRKGALDTTKDEYHKWFKEFMDAGGQTGFVQVKNVEAWKKKISADINELRKKHDYFAVLKKTFQFVEDLNELAETIARFATYCASRESGRGVQRSAYDAKEVSVNFNRSGSAEKVKSYAYDGMSKTDEAMRNAYGWTSSYLRNYTMFFNASVQSANNLFANVKKAPARAIGTLMAAPMAIGILTPLINQMLMAILDDDERDRKGIKDPYSELPDYIRRNNWCLYTGKGRFITIPLAIELRAFYGLGDILSSYTFDEKLQEARSLPLDVMSQVSQIVPVGSFMEIGAKNKDAKSFVTSLSNALLPSAITPITELVANRDWKGMPIYNDSQYLDGAPRWKRDYSGTQKLLEKPNKLLNAWTNDVDKGNENIKGNSMLDAITAPYVFDQMLNGYAGGYGTFVARSTATAKATIEKMMNKDTEIEVSDIPFVRSLFHIPSERTSIQRTKAKWYNYRDEAKEASTNLSELKKETKDPLLKMRATSSLYKFNKSTKAKQIAIVNLYDKQIKACNNHLKTAEGQSKKYWLERRDKLMQDAVEQIERLED